MSDAYPRKRRSTTLPAFIFSPSPADLRPIFTGLDDDQAAGVVRDVQRAASP
jgi:hypothetical protein